VVTCKTPHILYGMTRSRRSGLANDRRAYRCYYLPIPSYTVTYNGNGNTSGNVSTEETFYTSGSTVVVLGNSEFAKSGFTFGGWNTATNGSGISYSPGNTFTINDNTILYAQWIPTIPLPPAPILLSSVGGNTEAYILFEQVETVTNYEYSTDDGETFLAFDPPQIFNPVNITTLSSDGVTPLTNETTYTVKLKAVNSGGVSDESLSVTVTPTITSLLSDGRIIHLDANNPSSYSGSGTIWTNLDSDSNLNATLLNSPSFDNANKWFTFDGIDQIAEIAASGAINPTTPFTPFTIQIWARVHTSSSQFAPGDGLISKQFGNDRDFDGYSLTLSSLSRVVLTMNGRTVNGTYVSPEGVYSNDWALYTIVVRFGGNNNAYVSTRRVIQQVNLESGMQHPNAPLQFPRGIQNTGANFCPADVGAFYLYNTILSQENIIRNFDATKPRYI
jgi:uncharacterized repeat protein (TIGR02543 family)